MFDGHQFLFQFNWPPTCSGREPVEGSRAEATFMSTMNIQESAVRILEYFRRHAAGSTPFCMQISSRNPGAHVVIVGGTHGNEPGGVKAIVQLHRAFRNGEITLKQGKISFLIGNPKAYEKDVRYIDSDLNLSLIHISEPTRPFTLSRMPSSA